MRESGQPIWWRKSGQLAAGTIAALVLLAIAPLTGNLESITVLGLSLSYLLFTLPFPLAMIATIFWFAGRQRAFDHRFDVLDG